MSPTRPFVRTPASLKPSSRSSPSARGRGSLSPCGVLGVRWRSGLVRFAPRFSAFVPSANLMFPSFPDPILSRGVRMARAKSFWPNLCSNRVFAAAGCGGLRADLRTFPPQLFCSPPSAEARVRGIERAHEVVLRQGAGGGARAGRTFRRGLDWIPTRTVVARARLASAGFGTRPFLFTTRLRKGI